MPFEVWVRLKDTEFTFTEDPDSGTVADDLTVLSGMRFGWSMPGPLWPVQPNPMTAAISVNLPDFVDLGPVRAGGTDCLAIEVRTDTGVAPIARFYGDITDYKASPRDGRTGVTLSVVAVDYTVRLHEEYHAPFIFPDDGTANTDQELMMRIDGLWPLGDTTGLGEHNSEVHPEDYVPAVTLDDAYLNLDGPLPVPIAEFVDKLLAGMVGTGAGTSGRFILSPQVVDELSPPWHGLRVDGVHVTTTTGVFYGLDWINAEVLALSMLWELPADAIELESLAWANVKGGALGYVTTSGWEGDQQNTTYSAVTGTGVNGQDVPVMIQDEVNAQSVSDFYADRADVEPWQIDRVRLPVTRFLNAGGDLNMPAGLCLTPDWTLVPEDPARGMAYSTGIFITDVDTTVTPDGASTIEGILTGMDCAIEDGRLVLELALRRTEVGIASSVAATVTIAASNYGGTISVLNDFVTRVNLADITDLAWWALATSDGGNIRVLDAFGNPVPFDLTKFNLGAKTGELFFKGTLGALILPTSSVFTITVNVGDTALPVTDTYGRNACWSGFDAVMIPSADYAAGLSVSTLVDRTGAAHTITTAGISGGALPTLTANGLTFGATASSYVQCSGLTLRSAWTMGCRARQNVNDNTSERTMMAYGVAGSTSGASREALLARQLVNNNFAIHNSTDAYTAFGAGLSIAAALNQWHRWTGTHNGTTNRTIRHDGGTPTVDTGTAVRPPSPGDAIIVGNELITGVKPWRGDIDYLYLRNGVLTDTWLAAETLSWETPASFYVIT